MCPNTADVSSYYDEHGRKLWIVHWRFRTRTWEYDGFESRAEARRWCRFLAFHLVTYG